MCQYLSLNAHHIAEYITDSLLSVMANFNLDETKITVIVNDIITAIMHQTSLYVLVWQYGNAIATIPAKKEYFLPVG